MNNSNKLFLKPQKSNTGDDKIFNNKPTALHNHDDIYVNNLKEKINDLEQQYEELNKERESLKYYGKKDRENLIESLMKEVRL